VEDERVGVVGGGIIGLAVARRLAQLRPEMDITVLEKEREIAQHQTGRNSGVVHAGIYYAPGSLKARLCRKGVGLLREFCAKHGIPYVECGKVVVAVDDKELARLRDLEHRARANAVPGVRWLDAEELRDVEPHVTAVAGLHSPTTAITDYRAIARALRSELEDAGGSVQVCFAATRITPVRSKVRIAAGENELEFDRLVICAGLQSDRLARQAGDAREPTIVPFRGEYYRLLPRRDNLVRGLVYPVPNPAYPFLGIHFTRHIDGGIDVGPNAVLAFAREGYRRRDVRLGDLREILASPGFRRLARRHWRMGLSEMKGSAFKRAYVKEARRYIPELQLSDFTRGKAGVRAQALDPDGSLVDDFRISQLGRVTAVRNAPSPGATSSLAIAEHIASAVLGRGTGRLRPGDADD
jgi:L-2-hydroxyglutarate oxidase LhgO